MRGCPKPTGFRVVLKSQKLSCGKQAAQRLRDALRDTRPPLAELHHAAHLLVAASQPDRADTRRWMCESSTSFAICRTVWMRMRWVSNLRSGTRQRMSTPRRCLQWWWSNEANWEPLVSRSEKCFPRSLRPRRAVGLCAAREYASLRVRVPNVSCYQWMITLIFGHDVNECVFVYFGVIS